MLHSHYQGVDDDHHTGYDRRAQILLQRSLDHGETWPRENDVVVWDESRPLEEKRAILYRADEPGVAREQINLTSPDAAVYFARAQTGPVGSDGHPSSECFAFRSGDRGHTWETVPTHVTNPTGEGLHRDAHPLVQFPDGTLMGVMSIYDVMTVATTDADAGGGVAVFGSDDNGLTWEYVAEVNRDPTGLGRTTYAGLLLLPSGRLQCYMLNIDGIRNAIQMAYSDDGGYSWSDPKPIVAWGESLWAARRKPDAARQNVHYRSPWPMRLRDGRIVVIFGRRKPPLGIGLLVSGDDRATWSAEAVLGDYGRDLSYPVATQLDDGRIFTVYGTSHILGSFFRLT